MKPDRPDRTDVLRRPPFFTIGKGRIRYPRASCTSLSGKWLTFIDTMTTLALLVVVAILVMATTARAEPTEAQIKAAYLYNFAKFVEWPDQPANGRFNICIDGDTEIIDAAATLEDKTVAGLRVSVLRVETAEAVVACRMVLLDQGWGGLLRPSTIGRRDLLTVGPGIEFAEEGGTIGLFYSQRKLRFAINIDALAAAGLRVNSKLLNLAHIVRRQ